MSKAKKTPRYSDAARERIKLVEAHAAKAVAETTEAAQRLDERRKAQIRLQIDSINRLLDDPSAADEIVRVTENAAANRFLVDALLDRLNAYHGGGVPAERFFVMIGEAVEMRNRMVVGDEPTPPATLLDVEPVTDDPEPTTLDLSGARQDALNAEGRGWGNPGSPRRKTHYYIQPGTGASSLCGTGKASDRSRRPIRESAGDRSLCSKCAALLSAGA